eukprot:scaffold269791_cov30-Tisochrysis_lutea.AAC.1
MKHLADPHLLSGAGAFTSTCCSKVSAHMCSPRRTQSSPMAADGSNSTPPGLWMGGSSARSALRRPFIERRLLRLFCVMRCTRLCCAVSILARHIRTFAIEGPAKRPNLRRSSQYALVAAQKRATSTSFPWITHALNCLAFREKGP